MIWLIEILTILARRTVSDRVLRDKAFDIAKNLKYNGYQNVLASMIYNFFDKKPGEGSGFKSPIKLISFVLSYTRISWRIAQSN